MKAKNVILLTMCLGGLIGCSSVNETVPEISAPPETVTLSETTVSNDTAEENATEKLNEDYSDVPDIVLQEAEAWVVETYEDYNNNNFIDWRITSLEHCYIYENLYDMTLQVFRINFEFLSDTPEDVTLIGGMSMTEDGWVVPDYPNSRYLIFQQDGDLLVFVTRMAENDCEPGDETFTGDLERKIEETEYPEML